MTKKKNPPGKNQRDRKTAKKIRDEGAEKSRHHVEPKKQAHVDEKGRKLTVVMGGETEMNFLWEQMKTTHALQRKSDSIANDVEILRANLAGSQNAQDGVQEDFEKLEHDAEVLQSLMRDAMFEKQKTEVAHRGIHILDFFPLHALAACKMDDNDILTGFENELAEIEGRMKDLRLRLATDV
ncbi:hypothetical protein CH63R_02083 [Colletotrichum higginsianum IMI 349063]|uniref:Uncharacterized protein n=3 Tax=Colletotrichum higginsianum TaxID=80884 RepID=A0A1B7YMS4_COLHI|nr:hypothetical protein CH63R_02083 [Colletotrichum higginsianum IMI 349063]OBR13357.1 hypothetical protein CH63R_02083 [Colletotrichum higginsianum IMI 349063]